MNKNSKRDTYKYQVKRDGIIILRGRTYDLNRRAAEHKAQFPDAIIEQVGRKVTAEEAELWLERKSKR